MNIFDIGYLVDTVCVPYNNNNKSSGVQLSKRCN